jgi:transcriptional regulator with GAF, ATPase, and Fis domain
LAHNDDAAREGLAVLARYVIGGETLGATLARVTHLASTSVPADMAGITMLVEGRPTTAVFTDDDAPAIDAHQYDGAGGPCMDAFTHRRPVSLPLIADDTRWPQFTATAAHFGIASTLSVPLISPVAVLGALNLYSRAAHAFGADRQSRAETFADQAAAVLVNARVYQDAQELNFNLRQALESRATIHYAMGIIMGADGHDPESAFAVLTHASQSQNRKVRDIANDMVQLVTQRADPPPAPSFSTPDHRVTAPRRDAAPKP